MMFQCKKQQKTNEILIHTLFVCISSAQNLILTEKQREMAICGGDKADGEKVALIREDETRTRVWQRGRGERTHSPSVKVEARAPSLFSSSSSSAAAASEICWCEATREINLSNTAAKSASV